MRGREIRERGERDVNILNGKLREYAKRKRKKRGGKEADEEGRRTNSKGRRRKEEAREESINRTLKDIRGKG